MSDDDLTAVRLPVETVRWGDEDERVLVRADGRLLPADGLITLLATPAPPTGGAVTLVTADDPDQAVAVGGWEAVARVGLRPVRWWRAPGDGTLELDLALDTRLVPGPGMPARLRALAAMGQPLGEDDADAPPRLRLLRQHMPLAAGRWVMQGLQLGKATVVAGEHVRQDVTVALEPFEAVDPLRRVTVRRTRGQSAGRRRDRTIRARQGDTLRSIAVRELGSVGQWRAIRQWNKALRRVDPDERLRTGTRVRLL